MGLMTTLKKPTLERRGRGLARAALGREDDAGPAWEGRAAAPAADVIPAPAPTAPARTHHRWRLRIPRVPA
jgi:hypothetical protein